MQMRSKSNVVKHDVPSSPSPHQLQPEWNSMTTTIENQKKKERKIETKIEREETKTNIVREQNYSFIFFLCIL